MIICTIGEKKTKTKRNKEKNKTEEKQYID